MKSQLELRRNGMMSADLPPAIGIDPGGTYSAIAVRVGNECLAYEVIKSDARKVQVSRAVDGRPVEAREPDPRYESRVVAAVYRLMSEHDAEARAWWLIQGVKIPADQTPWLVGCEKQTPPRENHVDGCPGHRPGDESDSHGCWLVTAGVAGGLAACGAVEAAVRWRLDQQVARIYPYRADERHLRKFGGSGDATEYWPRNLLDAAQSDSTVGHALAAWHIATDTGADYRYLISKASGGQLLPPHVGWSRLQAAKEGLFKGIHEHWIDRLEAQVPVGFGRRRPAVAAVSLAVAA